ncbi:MAG: DUF2064 domain-containing protein [Firmicutes bacterium]|nr:DUF2064 domain-containing protein [Bacillota bacterium]
MQSAIVVFTKVPKTGDVKTRLTTEGGGILTPEEAKRFYEACLLDVIDACIASACGDFYICYNAKGDRDHLEELLGSVSDRRAIKGVYADQGGTFDQCMQYAADYILKDGCGGRLADSVLIVGGDLPSLQPATIREAVNKLERLASSESGQKAAKKLGGNGAPIGAAIVEGACQEGGFSLVGYTCTTPLEFDGVFYNRDGVTALDALVYKASERNIPFGLVEMIPDVDIPADLASLISALNALKLAARYDTAVFLPKRTIKAVEEMGLVASAAPSQR